MRKIISMLMITVMLITMASPVYADTIENSVTIEDSAAIALYGLKLFSGAGTDANGVPIFDLDRAPTRQEAITMLVTLLGKKEEALAGKWTTPFTDVDTWAKPYVGYAYEKGLTSGISLTKFGGSNPVTSAQYLTFVLKALGYESGKDFQWDSAFVLSDKIGFTSGGYSNNTSYFTRGDATSISYNALSANIKDSKETLIKKLGDEGAIDKDRAALMGLDAYGWFSNVQYVYDIRMFTYLAFINYTGYDDNNGYPIEGPRKMLRDELNAMNLKISSPNYYKDSPGQLKTVVASLGDAPNFNFVSNSTISQKRLDLPGKLAEFYVAADIPKLYEKYRPYHEELIAKYKKAVPGYLVPSIAYFKIGDLAPKELVYQPMPLYRASSGFSLEAHENLYYNLPAIYTGAGKVTGEVHASNIVHEYYHIITRPITDKYASEINAISSYYKPNSQAVVTDGYQGWHEIVDESFARAIACYYYEGFGRAVAVKDTDKGFVMTTYIYARIPEFANYKGTFEEFCKMLIVEYPKYAK